MPLNFKFLTGLQRDLSLLTVIGFRLMVKFPVKMVEVCKMKKHRHGTTKNRERGDENKSNIILIGMPIKINHLNAKIVDG